MPTRPSSLRSTRFKHGYTVKYNLAPPLISKRDPVSGDLQKKAYGPWMLGAFKWDDPVQGPAWRRLDIFGKTEERSHERQLIEDYVKLLDDICGSTPPTMARQLPWPASRTRSAAMATSRKRACSGRRRRRSGCSRPSAPRSRWRPWPAEHGRGEGLGRQRGQQGRRRRSSMAAPPLIVKSSIEKEEIMPFAQIYLLEGRTEEQKRAVIRKSPRPGGGARCAERERCGVDSRHAQENWGIAGTSARTSAADHRAPPTGIPARRR